MTDYKLVIILEAILFYISLRASHFVASYRVPLIIELALTKEWRGTASIFASPPPHLRNYQPAIT